MAQTVPTREPAFVVAGDTITWQKSLADYPASAGWVLNYRLINAAGKIDITTAASGDDHLVSVAAATSSPWAAGSYTWTAYVEKAAERFTVGNGSITVKPNLAGESAGFDSRSTAAKALAAVEAWMTSRDLAVAEYEIAGRRMKYIPMGDLLKLRNQLKAEVSRETAAERLAQGLVPASKVYVRF